MQLLEFNPLAAPISAPRSLDSAHAVPRSLSRHDWIDMARGFAMLLVMVGHTNLSETARLLFQPCRMPLFYVTAGYLFNYSRHQTSLWGYMGQRSRRLLGPYFLTALIFYVVSEAAFLLVNGEFYHPLKQFLAIFYGNSASYSYPNSFYTLKYNLPLWFLTCMTSTSLIFIALLHYFRNDPNRMRLMIASAAIAMIGYLIGRHLFLPWNLDLAMIAQFLMLLGLLLRENHATFQDKRIFTLLLLVYACMCISGKFSDMDMNGRKFHDLGQFFIAGVAGTYTMFFLNIRLLALQEASAVARAVVAFLRYIGRHTMVIMSFHFIAIYVLMVLGYFFPRHDYAPESNAFLTLVLMFTCSIGAVAIVNRIKPLRRIYYKEH